MYGFVFVSSQGAMVILYCDVPAIDMYMKMF